MPGKHTVICCSVTNSLWMVQFDNFFRIYFSFGDLSAVSLQRYLACVPSCQLPRDCVEKGIIPGGEKVGLGAQTPSSGSQSWLRCSEMCALILQGSFVL